jgi:predicted nucleotidyltransferase
MQVTALTKHQRIIDQLLDQYRKHPNIVAITLFGSLAKGGAHPGSDIDIEVISTAEPGWKLVKNEYDGIAVDLVFVSKAYFENLIQRFPYLCYDYISEKTLYDPDDFFVRAQAELCRYFEAHAEVAEYWQKNLDMMRSKKKAGTQRRADIVEAYDMAELRFSADGRITRDFLRD